MKPSSGRKPRLTEQERSAILALLKLPPPGKATYALTGKLAAPDPENEPEWTLDTLTAARARGIQVARSQVRRIFRKMTARGCAGGARGYGPPARTPTSPQKSGHLRALYGTA